MDKNFKITIDVLQAPMNLDDLAIKLHDLNLDFAVEPGAGLVSLEADQWGAFADMRTCLQEAGIPFADNVNGAKDKPKTKQKGKKAIMPTPSRAEVDKLKADWLSDGCWDIEGTEGFESYHDELLIFRLKVENEHLNKQIAEFEAFMRIAKKIFARD